MTERAAANCYASFLGPCDRMSGEHVISRNIFGDGMLRTRNLRAPDDHAISVDSLTANILCRAHNSRLGNLDDEIKKLSDVILIWRETSNSVCVSVNGYLIERWLLKTIVSVFLSGWLKSKIPVLPGAVRAIFGIQRLKIRDALYVATDIPIVVEHEKLAFFEFFKGLRDPERGAMFIVIHGVALVYSDGMDDPQSALRACGTLLGYDVSKATLTRHPPEAFIRGSLRTSELTIRFRWSDRIRTSITDSTESSV